MLAVRASAQRPVVWVRQDFAGVEAGQIYAPGIAELGLSPDRLILVTRARWTGRAEGRRGSRAVSAAWRGADRAMGRAKGAGPCRDTAARARGRPLERTALHGACRRNAQRPSAALNPMARACVALGRARGGSPGHPTFEVELLRDRAALRRNWTVEWNRDQRIFKDSFGSDRPAVSGRMVPLPAGGSPDAGAGPSEPSELPLVVTEKVKGAQRLMAISPHAKREGLAVGMTLADSRGAYSGPLGRGDGLSRRRRFAGSHRGGLRPLFAGVVVIDGPDGLLLDITGCDHILGGETELRRIFSPRFRRGGFHMRTVIATAPLTPPARWPVSAAPPSCRRERRPPPSAPLPIAALGLAEKDRLAISRAGLKTIGALADRPSLIFAARFGEAMTLHLRRIQGLADPPLTPRRAVPMLWLERRFPEPIGRVEDVETVLFRARGGSRPATGRAPRRRARVRGQLLPHRQAPCAASSSRLAVPCANRPRSCSASSAKSWMRWPILSTPVSASI